MKTQISSVEQFHKAMEVLTNEKPTLIDVYTANLRFKLMEEENFEYREACLNGDLTEVADALTDKLYILFGTIITHGMQNIIADCFNEVHRSNMSKLDENGKPIINGKNGVFNPLFPKGKILKPDSYSKPDLTPFVFGF